MSTSDKKTAEEIAAANKKAEAERLAAAQSGNTVLNTEPPKSANDTVENEENPPKRQQKEPANMQEALQQQGDSQKVSKGVFLSSNWMKAFGYLLDLYIAKAEEIQKYRDNAGYNDPNLPSMTADQALAEWASFNINVFTAPVTMLTGGIKANTIEDRLFEQNRTRAVMNAENSIYQELQKAAKTDPKAQDHLNNLSGERLNDVKGEARSVASAQDINDINGKRREAGLQDGSSFKNRKAEFNSQVNPPVNESTTGHKMKK